MILPLQGAVHRGHFTQGVALGWEIIGLTGHLAYSNPTNYFENSKGAGIQAILLVPILLIGKGVGIVPFAADFYRTKAISFMAQERRRPSAAESSRRP